jgi:hypothetical protein
MKQTFTTIIFQAEGKNATGLHVPPEVVAAFNSGKRPAVKVHIRGHIYESTVAGYGDVFLLPLSAENREAAGVNAGDEVEVTLELETKPRTVEVPEDLAEAMADHKLTDVFDALAPSRRKEFVRQVVTAKAQNTRERRIAKIIAQLTEQKG